MVTPSQRVQEVMEMGVGAKPKVALDTNSVQYYLSKPPVQPWADCLDPIFQAGLDGRVELFVSTVVVTELLSHAHYSTRHTTGYDPELDLMTIIARHFQVLDINEQITRAAGRLRGCYLPGDKMSLKTPDALIGATSLAYGHTLFVTNDQQLAHALPSNNCIYLRDLALDWLGQHFPERCIPDMSPVPLRKRGAGILNNAALASLELGSLKPKPSARWDRLLSEAFYAATALNEPCLFFILTTVGKSGEETEEILFWDEGLIQQRPVRRVIKRLYEHLGYNPRTRTATNMDNNIHAFCFTSQSRERARQNQPGFGSKTNVQREFDAWHGYIWLLWLFKDVLALPQTNYLLCEEGVARRLDITATAEFIDNAKNVFGWKDEQ
jgi:predicted nucleic acid-binding protein